MFVVYAKDEDDNIACSDRYQETEFLGVYSTIELAKEQIEYHKNVKKRLLNNPKIVTPSKWGYYIYSCELDQKLIIDETNASHKME